MSSTSPPQGFFGSRAGFVCFALLVIAGFYLLTEHRAHLFGALPYLLLLACPLMHVFMHRGGHGGHGSTTSDSEKTSRTGDGSPP